MSTVAKKVLMGSGAVAEFGIDQSAILDDVGNAHLKRTPGSAGNRRTFTLSCWIKRATENAISAIFAQDLNFLFESGSDERALKLGYYTAAGHQIRLATTAVFRDMSAWYHIVLAVDTTQSTASNRVKMYINGVQQTSFQSGQNTYPSQNLELPVNNTTDVFYLGALNATAYSIGYLAETNFIDGTARAASDFGETNEDTGQWIPKEYTGGSYGTNGFYLKFASGAIGTDSSGEGNDLTAVNLANSDVVPDSPTNNFATMNPLVYRTANGTQVYSEGNLKYGQPTANSWGFGFTTLNVKSGKWYAEMICPGLTGGVTAGVSNVGHYGLQHFLGQNPQNATGQWILYLSGTTTKSRFNGSLASETYSVFNTGQILGIALNADDKELSFYVDGTLQSSLGSSGVVDISTGGSANDEWSFFANTYHGASEAITWNFGQNSSFLGTETATSNSDGNGVGAFHTTPPSGYLALCTANLPDPAIPLPSAHFNTVLYTGTGATPQTVTGVGFQPDFVWIKNRPTDATNYVMYDAVRGTNKTVASSTTNAESSDDAAGFSAFTSDGFTLRSLTTAQGTQNALNQAHVSWNWKANGSGSTNNDGNQASVVSANQTAGFSIATFTGTGSYATYGHGLGVIPEVTLTKSRSATGDWYWVTTAIDGSVDYLVLNTTAAKANGSATASTTSVFYSNYPNNQTVVAYNFASKPGFSKIGVYTGNGNASGPMVNTGFKPAWVMVKKTSATNNWILQDNQRSTFNLIDDFLAADEAQAESTTSAVGIDFLSNGFKIRNSANAMNTNSGTYLYMAFAESPFKTANAR